MASLSKKWHPTILAALDADAEDGTVHISLPHIARFIDYADAQLRAARNRLSRWQGRSGRCGH